MLDIYVHSCLMLINLIMSMRTLSWESVFLYSFLSLTEYARTTDSVQILFKNRSSKVKVDHIHRCLQFEMMVKTIPTTLVKSQYFF